MAERPKTRRWPMVVAPIVAALATFALMVATEPGLAMGWDEGYTLGREARIRLWFRALRDPEEFSASWVPPKPLDGLVDDTMRPPTAPEINTRPRLFSPRNLAWFWPFGREEPHGHPPFYALVGMVGDVLAPGWAPLPRARLGPMIAFSLAAGAIFGAFLKRSGPWSASAAMGAWVLSPQMFALGHYATYDALLSALWVGAILAFARAVEGPRWGSVVLFGLFLGWAADTKLTGWFLPLPFLVWTALTRSRRGLGTLAVGGAIALATLYAFNPPWWPDPIAGVERFFRSNLSRARTIPIPIQFLGTIYQTPKQSLPPYNTLVWTTLASPVLFLVLALIGTARTLRARLSADPLPALALANWAFLLALRALPNTPGHDGIRQFLPAFGCLALMAGEGAALAASRWGRWGRALVVAAIGEAVVSLVLIWPVPLSYFSPIVGGLPGAVRLGMEPTYFWDALSRDALDRLARETPSGRTVRFATFPTSWVYLRREGVMEFGLFPIDPGPPAWYVVQNRPGALGPIDRALIARLGPRCVLVEKFGVPLIWAFPDDEVKR